MIRLTIYDSLKFDKNLLLNGKSVREGKDTVKDEK